MLNISNPDLAIDAEAESNGKWVSTPWDGVKFFIAGAQTPKYHATLRAVLRKRNCTTLAELAEKEQDEVLCEAIAKACFLGWEGLYTTDENGNRQEVEYSTQTAIDILLDRRFIRIRDFVTAKAAMLSTFNIENTEAISKN